MMHQCNARIAGVQSIFPKDSILNEDLGYDKTWIDRVGINVRHLARPTDRLDDLASIACHQLCDKLSWASTEIDVCVVVTQTPDLRLPGVALHIQEKLGLRSDAVCFDLNLGCSGYPYGLYVVSSLLEKVKGKGLLITGDFSSRIVDSSDSSTSPIFSDGLAVSAIEFDANNIMRFSLNSDGKGSPTIHCTTHGKLTMDGMSIFSFALSTIPKHIQDFMRRLDMKHSEIDGVFLHQANKMISEGIIRRLGWPSSLFPSTLSKYGNTSSASIPITLSDHYTSSPIQKENWVLFTGFGVGLSWGSVLVKLDSSFVANTMFR